MRQSLNQPIRQCESAPPPSYLYLFSDENSIVVTLGIGKFFGERALLRDEPASATVRAAETVCRTSVLKKLSAQESS